MCGQDGWSGDMGPGKTLRLNDDAADSWDVYRHADDKGE